MAQAVLHCRVHLEQAVGLPVCLRQTVLDDPCYLPVVLLLVDLPLDDGGLGQDLLVVLLGHLELFEAGDGLGDHLLDQILRCGVLGDVVGARSEPALDVAAGFGGQTDSRRVGVGRLDLLIGEVADLLEALLDALLGGAGDDGQRVIALALRIEQCLERGAGGHLLLELVGARLDRRSLRVVLRRIGEGLAGGDDAFALEDVADVRPGGPLRDRHGDLALALALVVLSVGRLGRGVAHDPDGLVAQDADSHESDDDDKARQPVPAPLALTTLDLLHTPLPAALGLVLGVTSVLIALDAELGEEIVVAHALPLLIGWTRSPAGTPDIRSVVMACSRMTTAAAWSTIPRKLLSFSPAACRSR